VIMLAGETSWCVIREQATRTRAAMAATRTTKGRFRT